MWYRGGIFLYCIYTEHIIICDTIYLKQILNVYEVEENRHFKNISQKMSVYVKNNLI